MGLSSRSAAGLKVRNTSIGSVKATRFGMGGGYGTTFQVLGIPEAIAKLQLAGSIAGREGGLIAYQAAHRVEAEAKETVHSSSNQYDPEYDYTDQLRDSIQVSKIGLYSYAITASSDHAMYEEFGTSHSPAHPFLQPALYGRVGEAQAALVGLAAQLEAL